MQRLFSMFPTGLPGAALLLLRLCVAGTLWPHFCVLEGLLSPLMCDFLIGTLALLLCAGALTPICCAFVLGIQAAAIARSGGVGVTEDLIYAAIAASLAPLGPGAYSVDARLFGRRIILPDRDKFE